MPLAASGDLADFAKFGYNADAIVIEGNDFGDGHSVVTAVDKAQAIAGTLVFYQSTPAFNFRALDPAQMHDAIAGGPMWFMASTGDPTYDGTTPNTIRVTEMTNILSNSPTYTDFAVSVNTYGPNSGFADQPGAPGSVATNDVTTTSVDYLGRQAGDGLQRQHRRPMASRRPRRTGTRSTSRGGTPILVQEGLIDPGPGVATFFPAAAIDAAGNIGISYMESSSTEFVSAYVAGHIAGTPLGTTTAGTVFGPGGGSMPESFREGDYGSAVYDPGTGLFWGANEYIGSDGSTDIWRTKITSFSLVSAIGTDFYSVNANAGDNLHFATTHPGRRPERVRQQLLSRAAALRPERQPGRRRRRQRVRRPQLGDRLHGARWRRRQVDHRGHAVAEHAELRPRASTACWSPARPGLCRPFVVTSTIPPDGALIQPPTDYIATFSQPILGTSLTPGELDDQRRPGHRGHPGRCPHGGLDDRSRPRSRTGNRVLNTAVISADAHRQPGRWTSAATRSSPSPRPSRPTTWRLPSSARRSTARSSRRPRPT